MIFAYGTHRHALGEVGLTVTKKSLRNDADVPWAYEETWTIDGMLTTRESTNTAATRDIKRKMQILERAYAVESRDAILFFANGTTRSQHVLISNQCVGGVRILEPPHYPDGRTVQGVTMRTFRIVLQAIVPLNPNAMSTALKSFTETLEIQPAGARFGHLETLIGLPVKQQLRQHQVYRVSQVGQAVGIYQRPPVPPPIWPFDVVNTSPLTTIGQPRRIGNSYIDWPIAWRWEFESAFPLRGSPNIWNVTYP